MFIQIPSKNVFCSDNCGLAIRCIGEPFFLNLDSLIQVEFQGCVIHKVFANYSVRLEHLTQTASCKYGLEVALNSIKSRGRRDYGARYYNSLLFN